MVTIVTDNKWRDLYSFDQLPEKRQDEFYLLHMQLTDSGNYDDSLEFFKYRGDWHALSNFVRISSESPVGFEYGVSPDSPLANWSGISHGTIDSGWVVRLARTQEECDYHSDQVIVGRFY